MQKAKSRIHFFSFLAQRNWEWRIFFSRSATRKKKLYGWSSSQHWHHHCSDGGDIKLLEILREPSDLRIEALKKWRRQNWHLAGERRKKGLSNSNFWILFLGEDSCPTQHCSSYFRERVGFFLAQYLRFDWSFSCVRATVPFRYLPKLWCTSLDDFVMIDIMPLGIWCTTTTILGNRRRASVGSSHKLSRSNDAKKGQAWLFFYSGNK